LRGNTGRKEHLEAEKGKERVKKLEKAAISFFYKGVTDYHPENV